MEEGDGSYTVGSLTGLEDERNVNIVGEIAKVLHIRGNFKLNDRLRSRYNAEFRKVEKDGILPAVWGNFRGI